MFFANIPSLCPEWVHFNGLLAGIEPTKKNDLKVFRSEYCPSAHGCFKVEVIVFSQALHTGETGRDEEEKVVSD